MKHPSHAKSKDSIRNTVTQSGDYEKSESVLCWKLIEKIIKKFTRIYFVETQSFTLTGAFCNFLKSILIKDD